MQRLVLTADQLESLATATGTLEVVDAAGHPIGELTITDFSHTETQVLTPEILAQMKRHKKESPLDKGPSFKSPRVHDKA